MTVYQTEATEGRTKKGGTDLAQNLRMQSVFPGEEACRHQSYCIQSGTRERLTLVVLLSLFFIRFTTALGLRFSKCEFRD